MSMKAPVGNKYSEKALAPQGSHVARLYAIAHIGTLEKEFKGETKMQDTLRLTFELCNEKFQFAEGEEKPFAISKESTLSMHEKSFLRKCTEAILNVSLLDEEATAFDIEELLGGAVLLNVKHVVLNDGKKIARIADVTPLPKGMTAPEAVNPLKIFNIDTATLAEIEELPEFLKKKVFITEQFQKRFPNEATPNPDLIPF